MPVRGVLFDLDDTLFDHNFATIQALDGLCVEEPAFRCWPVDELRARYSVLLEELHAGVLSGRVSIPDARYERFRRLLSDATNAPVSGDRPAHLSAFYRTAYEGAWRAVPGAIPLLTTLRERGLPIAIVTNNLVQEQRQKLERCGMDSLVDALITSEEVGIVKPDPGIFRAALDRIGLQAEDAVMVGDAWATDIVGAQNAGVRAVWFNWRHAASPDPSVPELRALAPMKMVLEAIDGR
jgi:putative hydrolase of the HAD superfamily